MTAQIRMIVLLALVTACSAATPGALEEPLAASSGARGDWSELPDFDELRWSYGDRDDFGLVCEQDRPLEEAFDALEAQEWQRILELSDPWLAQCLVDVDLHLLRAIALGELGRSSESRQQLRWRDGLVESVLRTGDGKTPETAWVVISVGEEYSMLRALGMQVKSQALTREHLDKIEAERDGKVYTLYFDPAPHFRRLERQFGTPR